MRRRLAFLVAATTSLVVIAFLVPMLILIGQLAADRAVASGITDAQALAPVLASTGDHAAYGLALDQVNGESPRRTSIFLPDGTVLGAPAVRNDQVDLARRGKSFVAHDADGRSVLVPVRLATGEVAVVRTFVPGQLLHAGVTRAYVVLCLLALGLVAVAVIVAERLARSLIRPLLAVARVADRLHEGDLHARAIPRGTPETARIAEALNRLAGRIEDLLQAERETVADLSHRLRTPLTALRLDAEGLRDPEEAERLGADVDAIERMVSHVIAQARRPVRQALPASTDLCEVARLRVAFWSALAEEQGRPVWLDIPDRRCPVPLDAAEVAAALDALLDNAFAHTPTGTAVTVGVDAGPPVRLIVEDYGPGLRDVTLLQRGRSGRAGTGLGLDIVRRTAQSAHGRLLLQETVPSGLRVVLELGPPPGWTPRRIASRSPA